MSTNPLESLIRDVTDALARTPDTKLVVDAVAESVRKLLAGPVAVDESYLVPSRDRIARHVLHQDARFLVVVCAWHGKQSTPVHDHATWGVIAAFRNRIHSIGYRRLDDGTTPGFASLAEMTRLLVSETSFALQRPPDEDIHRLENPFAEPAATLHVFGAHATQHAYDPKQKMISELGPDAGLVGV